MKVEVTELQMTVLLATRAALVEYLDERYTCPASMSTRYKYTSHWWIQSGFRNMLRVLYTVYCMRQAVYVEEFELHTDYE